MAKKNLNTVFVDDSQTLKRNTKYSQSEKKRYKLTERIVIQLHEMAMHEEYARTFEWDGF
jgi:hypothetical protein